MNVTVTGGTGHSVATLHYDSRDLAEMNAQALAANIDKSYSTAIYYNPAQPPDVPSNGYLIVPKDSAEHIIRATGFGAIVDENNGVASTIRGGDSASGQTVLAGDGGLNFTAHDGSVTVVAGGGDNFVGLRRDTSTSAVYTSTGNDTIYAGGAGTVSAGTGDNFIGLGADDGAVLVQSSGQDTVQLGIGSDTIDVIKQGSDLVKGAISYSGSGFSLTFIGGSNASTVRGGAGSYDIRGGRGGGSFHGGNAGDNSIIGGEGAVTIFGGGAGDTLKGGAGNDKIIAGLGNETLGGGGGANVFDLTVHLTSGTAGDGTTIRITDFNSNDILKLGSVAADNYALNTAHVVGDNTVFSLDDGTKVVLQGFTHLTSTEIKH